MSCCSQPTTCRFEALKHAETLCTSAGTRLTPIRRKVLELIWQSHQPRKAYDVLADMAALDKSAKPPTVYRALDFLQDMGLVHRVESLNAYVGCNGNHAHQYLICTHCGTVSDIQDPQLTHAVVSKAKTQGFQVDAAIIEIKGTCERCLL